MHDFSASLTIPLVRAALGLDDFDGRAAQGPMEPAFRGPPPPRREERPARQAAALAYLYERAGSLCLPLTLRHADLKEHRGQVALPGGRPEPGEALVETAWREAREEIGLDPPVREDLGVLAPVYIPITHTTLHVYVATGTPPTALAAQPSEVERIEVARLAEFVDPRRARAEVRRIHDRDTRVPYFDVAGLVVWGATAMALSELVERLRRVLVS